MNAVHPQLPGRDFGGLHELPAKAPESERSGNVKVTNPQHAGVQAEAKTQAGQVVWVLRSTPTAVGDLHVVMEVIYTEGIFLVVPRD